MQFSRLSIAGIAVSNPADGMDVRCLCLLCVCIGSGLCDELITRSGESYGVFVCLIICDLETSKMGPRRTELGCCFKQKRKGLSRTADVQRF